jgi:hypothetical protein
MADRNNRNEDLGDKAREAGQAVRDKANEAAGRVKQGMDDMKDKMDGDNR